MKVYIVVKDYVESAGSEVLAVFSQKINALAYFSKYKNENRGSGWTYDLNICERELKC